MHILKDIPLFSALSDKKLSELSVSIRQYKKDNILFYEGDTSKYMHILLEGSVKLYKTTPSGKEIYLHSIEAPSVIAMGPALERRAFPATCALEVDGVIEMIDLDKFYICLENLECTVSIIKTMLKRLKDLEERIHNESVFSSEAKVADLLIKNASLFERLKNTEIASILNLTPETLSRILTKLKKQEIIVIIEHHVTVLDAEALYEIIDKNCLRKENTLQCLK